MRPKTIGLIAHTGKAGAVELVRTVIDEFARFSIPVLLEAGAAQLLGDKAGCTFAELGQRADLLVVLGGDGTILNAVDRLGENLKPIFGINIGSLGFLTCVGSTDYKEAVACIAAGEMVLSERTLLEVAIKSAGPGEPTIMIGLNDAVFSRGEVSRLVRVQTRVNGEPLTEFNADGLIIATPTGSTAYSLSAGGPIVAPESGALVITPICPHVLSNRSIILGADAVIEVEPTERDYPVYLSVDGREALKLESGVIVTVRKSERVLPLAALPGVSFFSVVRQKLKWRGSNV